MVKFNIILSLNIFFQYKSGKQSSCRAQYEKANIIILSNKNFISAINEMIKEQVSRMTSGQHGIVIEKVFGYKVIEIGLKVFHENNLKIKHNGFTIPKECYDIEKGEVDMSWILLSVIYGKEGRAFY